MYFDNWLLNFSRGIARMIDRNIVGIIQMRRIPYFVLDVFAERQLGGNPLAVYPDSSQLQEEELQRIAAEMNLSETVFVQESTEKTAVRRLRIFTPRAELPLAGHPVVGTWHLLASKDLVDFETAIAGGLAEIVRDESSLEKLVFRHELGAGVFPVTIYRQNSAIHSVVMDQDKPQFGDQVTDLDLVARALRIDKSLITASLSLPQPVSTGIWILIVPLSTRSALSYCAPNAALFTELYETYKVVGALAYTRDIAGDSQSAFASARGFFPYLGVPEDPATGSAAGCLGSYLAKNKILPSKPTVAFQIEQGVDMGRAGRINVEISMSGDDIQRVRVGGTAVITAEAELILP
jgi:trans-2,3-dihydro-3-hydroxyanthranilate isomerase